VFVEGDNGAVVVLLERINWSLVGCSGSFSSSSSNSSSCSSPGTPLGFSASAGEA
jgi:hypothetical protein